MHSAHSLLAKLETYLTCLHCHRVLHRPRTIRACQHSVCRVCLDQILANSAAPECPTCQHSLTADDPDCVNSAGGLERLIDCYYRLWRAARQEHTGVQRSESGLSEQTVGTVENRTPSPPPSSDGLQPLAPETPLDSSQMASIGSGSGRRKSAAIDAELRSGLVSNLVDDSSDSDTDLDLPNPGTLLSPIQGRVESGAPDDSEVQFVPETPPPPPLLLLASTMDTPLLRTPGSPRGKVAATYSAKGTPRARRSLGSALAARGRPALESAQLSTGNGSSSLTAVDDSGAAEHTESTPSARRTPKKRRPATAAADSPVPATPKRQKTLRGSKPDKPAQPAEQKTRTAPKDGDGNGPELRLLCTGLSEAQMTRVQRAAKQAQQHFASSVAVHRNAELLGNNASGGGGYTHVVAATGKDGRATRTFKYLAGLVSGAWVVTADWLLESVKAHKRLPEADFAVAGDSAMPQSTLVGPRPVGTLLRNYMVHLWGDDACWDAGSAHSPADMRALVVATGASVVEELASPGSSEDEDGGDSQPALTSKSRESVGAGVRHPGSRVEKEVAGLPAKYRRLFDLPAHEGQPIILVSGSDLSGARSSVALGAIISATGGTTPCRTKTWLFDCISAGQIL